MAKVWLWVVVCVIGLTALIWFGDYWYNYHTTGICRDDRGNSYLCGKAYKYSSDSDYYNTVRYSYYDNYGNRVNVAKNYDYDDFYDCYHARTYDSRYGELLREDYGIRCRGYEVVSDNYNTNKNSYSEKAPTIYVR